jgi:hypothetical protein
MKKLLAITSLLASTCFGAPVAFNVWVDTSSVATTSGSVAFTHLLTAAGDPQVTATISNFSLQGGSIVTPGLATGDVTGDLPGVVTLGDGSDYNDVVYDMTFGTGFSFRLAFDGAGLSAVPPLSSSATFLLTLLDSSGPILSTDPVFGSVLNITLDIDGQLVPTTYPAGAGLDPVVTAEQIPEPGSLAMVLGAALLLVVRKVSR